jgi:hypothetical protein
MYSLYVFTFFYHHPRNFGTALAAVVFGKVSRAEIMMSRSAAAAAPVVDEE